MILTANESWLAVPMEVRARWRALGLWADIPIGKAFEAAAVRYPTALLEIDSRERPATMTLATFHDRAACVAAALAARGIVAGDVIAIQMPNWAEGMIAFGAAALLGAVLLPIVHIYGAEELLFILRDSGARAYVSPYELGSTDFTTAMAASVAASHVEDRWFVVGGPSDDSRAWAQLEACTTRASAAIVDPDALALLIYTSGTTSAPKGVQHTSNSVLAELISEARDPHRHNVPTLSPWPIGHVSGLHAVFRFAFMGADHIFMDRWVPARAALLIETHGIGRLVATPTHLDALLDVVEADSLDVSSLVDLIAGGTTVPPRLLDRCQRFGLKPYRCYGSSEVPSATIGYSYDPIQKRINTDGRATREMEIRIVDEQQNDLPIGAEGEIVIRGPEMFLGYRDSSLDRDSFLRGGWFLSGDIGRLDSDGYLTVTDRKKDIIIRGGENISSREVEAILIADPRIGEAAVVAEPDPKLGERVCAFLVVLGEPVTLEDIRTLFIAAGVARQKTPERIEIVGELPRNATGKVMKQVLRAALRSPVA